MGADLCVGRISGCLEGKHDGGVRIRGGGV